MRQRAQMFGALALAVAAAVPLAACRQRQVEEVEVSVRHVGFDPEARAPVVVLETREGARLLPIWIGAAEADAIVREMREVRPARPLTHDLLLSVLASTSVRLQRVRITDLRDGTFYALLVLSDAGRDIEVDSRPSDAIALALRAHCPIVVSRALLDRVEAERAGAPSRREARGSSARRRRVAAVDKFPSHVIGLRA